MARQDQALYEQFQAERADFEAWLKARAERKDRAKRRRAVTSLADVQPVQVFLEVERADDEIIAIPTRGVSYTRLLEAQKAVPLPLPPEDGFDAATKRVTYNYNHPDYLEARETAFRRRNYAALFAWLDIDIPGDTLEAKIASHDATFISDETRQMFVALNGYLNKGEAKLQSAADTFHDAGPDDPSPVRAAREAGGVVLAAAGK